MQYGIGFISSDKLFATIDIEKDAGIRGIGIVPTTFKIFNPSEIEEINSKHGLFQFHPQAEFAVYISLKDINKD